LGARKPKRFCQTELSISANVKDSHYHFGIFKLFLPMPEAGEPHFHRVLWKDRPRTISGDMHRWHWYHSTLHR